MLCRLPLVALALLSPLLAASDAAHPPALDPTFGGTGYVHAVTERNAVVLSVLKELPDGKVVAGGNTFGYLGNGALVGLRYLADGAPDPSFHGDGVVRLDPCHCTSFSGGLAGFRLQEDGTLLFVGSAVPKREPGKQRHESIVVLRYHDDGTLDGGMEVVDLGGEFAVHAAAFPEKEGAAFVAGMHDNRIFVAKVRDRGAELDESFAAPRGWITPRVGGSASDASTMALDDEGRILVAGAIEEKGERDLVVARLLPSGALDDGFGKGGVVRLARPGMQQARGLAVLSDGRILVGGDTDDADARRFLLLRLRPDGELDPCFGDHGVALAPLGQADPYGGHRVSMAVMEDGRVLLGSNEVVDPEHARPAIARFLPDGSLDATFGEAGVATFAVEKGPSWEPSRRYGRSEQTELTAIALTRDGKLLVTGTWSAWPFQGFVARLTL